MIQTASEPLPDPEYAACEVVRSAIRTCAEQFDQAYGLPSGTTNRLMSCGRLPIDDEELEVLAYILHDLKQCYDAACAT